MCGLHHVGHVHGLIRNDTHARRMRRGQRRDQGDREYGNHGDSTREHARKIGGDHGIVHCRGRCLGGNRSFWREADGILPGDKLLRKDVRNSAWIGALLAGAALVILAVRHDGDTTSIGIVSAEVLAQGRQVYVDRCASCHGATLEGQPDWKSPLPSGRLPAPPHDASGHTWHHPDDVLFRIVKEGTAAIVGDGYESDMPGFADVLGDAEIRAVLAYIKSTWPERERRHQDRVSQAN